MRRLATIITLISLLVSCSEKQEEALFTLNGNTGMPKATVYLYGLDSSYERTDSAVCNENGEFAFELKLDSLTPLGLVIPDGKFTSPYPLSTLFRIISRKTAAVLASIICPFVSFCAS